MFVSYAERNFEVSPKLLLEAGEFAPMSTLFRWLPAAMSGQQSKLFAVTTELLVNLSFMTELAPITRAILLKSAHDLDRVLALDPEAAMQKAGTKGLTALELCVAWPEGLRRLLRTSARELIDTGAKMAWIHHAAIENASPVRRALRLGYAESVDVLMKAGCALDLVSDAEELISGVSRDCLEAIASNLAERRRDLLRLCQEKLGIHLDWHPIDVPDGEARGLCAALANFDIPVPRHLVVPPDYGTIFHFPGLHPGNFDIFWDRGFRGLPPHNIMGLTPIMVWRYRNIRNYASYQEMWEWARGGRLGDQTPQDPLGLGLNTSSTGWHYIAATVGFTFPDWDCQVPPFYCTMMQDLSQSVIRDQCVCWCSPNDDGCSVPKSLWTAWADWRGRERGYNDHDEVWRHSVLHIDRLSGGSNAALNITAALEFIRFVTFEALDMTHTCCYLEQVENLRDKRPISPAQRKALSAESNRDRYRRPHVIANCDQQLAEEIRSDSLEQQNALQLGDLMHEFQPQILSLDITDPKARKSNQTCARHLYFFIFFFLKLSSHERVPLKTREWRLTLSGSRKIPVGPLATANLYPLRSRR